MRERLGTLLGGVAAFLLVFVLVGPKSELEEPISLPTSGDSGEFGFAGLVRWLEEGQLPTVSWRRSYDHLHLDSTLPATGNLLVTSLPHRLRAKPAELEQLVHWLEQGNSALVLAAMSDWPEWARRSDDPTVFKFINALGYTLAPVGDPQAEEGAGSGSGAEAPPEAEPESRPLLLTPEGGHPLTAGVDRLSAHWLDSEGRVWRLAGNGSRRSGLVLLRDAEDGAPALWQLRVGSGRLWLSRHADLFGNRSLGEADNARLAANLIGAALGPGGRVLFDDRHQGLAALEDAEAFFADPRLHHTLGFLLLLWLVYLLGHSNRLGRLRSRELPVGLADEIRAFARFYARRVTPAGIGRRLLEQFHNEVRAARRLPTNGQPVWALLEADPRIDRRALAATRRLAARAEAGGRLPLTRLANHIHRLRESLR